MTYTQSNCTTRHMTNRSEAPWTHTEQYLAHLAAHVDDMLQQVPPRSAGGSRSCSRPRGRLHACQELQQHQGGGKERGNLVTTGTRVVARVEAERLMWCSVRRSAAQRLTALRIEPRSVVLVKVDVREVEHLAHWRARLQRMGST